MDRKEIQQALDYLRKNSPERKFPQSVDLIINLQNLNLKKPEHQVDAFIQLSHERGKTVKVCALVGLELKENAKENCDKVIMAEEFEQQEKKVVKKLANEYDHFIAQANLMPKVAKSFGRILGPRNKMPNPKAGCIVPPKANLAPLVARLKKTIRIIAKTEMAAKCFVGKQSMNDEELVDNISTIYNSIIKKLPQEKNNIKNVMLKFTMSKPVIIGKIPVEVQHG
jgi:large subunit ribosomal protein L1